MKIAIIAHDKKKDDILAMAEEYKTVLANYDLIATGTTGRLVREKTNLNVTCLLSGPFGGDQQIGGMVAAGEVDMVIFLRDPMTPLPHEPDITALIRICDVHQIPVATNLGTAKRLLDGLQAS